MEKINKLDEYNLSNLINTHFRNIQCLKVKQPYQIFNTWMGDPGKLLILEQVLKVIKEQNLLNQVKKSGKVLYCGLRTLEKEFPHYMHSVRGRGSLVSFTAATPELRDQILVCMKKRGIQGGGCGFASVRLRPSLIFEERHANIFLDILRKILKEDLKK